MSEFVPYRDYLRPRGLTWIKAALRVSVAVQCFGAAALRLSGGGVSPIADFLIVDLNWPAAQAGQFDNSAAYGLLACGILCALRPMWPVLLPVVVWFIANALVPLVRSVSATSEFVLLEQGVRFLSPLALLILDFWPPCLKSHLGRTVAAMWILRIAAASTLTGLGLMAVLHSVKSGPSLMLLQSVVQQSRGEQLTEVSARCWLGAVGGLSLALALNVLVTSSKPILVC
ncbi:MAG: hypothetical protein AB7I48_21640, partial [Planctomycetaceae bacterium]